MSFITPKTYQAIYYVENCSECNSIQDIILAYDGKNDIIYIVAGI